MLTLAIDLAPRRPRGAAAPPPGPQGDPALLSVNEDGWTAQYRIAGGAVPQTWANRRAFDPDAGDSVLVVRRAGFDAAAQPVTVTDLVPVTTEVRSAFDAGFGSAGAYTLQRTADGADAIARVALNAFVHAGDITEGVTNGSTRGYPPPQFAWLDRDLPNLTETTVTLRAVVGHAFARHGRPVAAVRFIVSDGTASAETLVSALTPVAYAGSGLGVPAYAGTVDISALADGPVTLDAIVYPWAGPAFRLSTDGMRAAGLIGTNWACSERAARKSAAGGGIPVTYAHVAASGGSDATGVASADPAVAAASPCATIAGAAAKIKAFNNATHARNDVSGGVIRLGEGTHTTPAAGGIAAGDTPTVPLVVEAAPGAARASVIVQSRSSMASQNMPNRAVFRNLTILNAGANWYFLRGTGSSSNALYAFEGCTVDGAANGSTNDNFVIAAGRLWLIDCTRAGNWVNFTDVFGTNGKNVAMIGCGRSFAGTAVTCAIASRPSYVLLQNTSTGRSLPATGAVVAFNWLQNAASSAAIEGQGTPLAATGFGMLVAGNLVEKTAASGQALRFWADGDNSIVRNLNVQMNTSPGGGDNGRFNRLYNDSGSNSAEKWGTFRMNVFPRWSSKTDTFPAGNAARTGNWPVCFHVGSGHSAMIEGGAAGNAEIGPLSWRLQCRFRGLQWGNEAGGAINPLWTDDRTVTGAGGGGGDYTPQAGSPLIRVPGADVPYGFDLLGRAVPLDGTAFAGAVQRPA
jgi:hypothetical protein